VNLDGSLPWGSDGLTLAIDVDEQHPASIYRDGEGGVVIGYQDNRYLDGSTPCAQVCAARVDAFGNLLWTNVLRECEYHWLGQQPVVDVAPVSLLAVGDGSGGGIFAWETWMHSRRVDVSAQGVDQHGGPPTPRLTLLLPDAAQSGASDTYVITGDYLDLTLGYELVHEIGSSGLPLTPNELHSYQLVEGYTAWTELDPGAYHLLVGSSGTPPDTLHFAMGIGPPPTCGGDEPIIESENNLSLEGSQRQSAIDPDGGTHMTWIEQDGTTGNYALMYQRWMGPTPPRSIYVSRKILRHPTLALDALSRVHLALVREESPTVHTVVRIKLNEGLDIENMDEWGGVYQHFNPVIAITGDTTVHIVYETSGTNEPYMGTRLEHVMIDGTNSHHMNFVPGWYPRNPDMVAIGEALLLIYAENSYIFGIQEVKTQFCRAGFPPTWDEAEVLDSGYGMASPSVAWDGAGRLLFAWIVDNEAIGGPPALVHTVYWENGGFGEIRARPGQTQHHAVSVGSTGPGKFAMLTLESEGGPNMGVWLRNGDGRCFFPRVQLDANLDVATPLLATSGVSGERMVYWHDYTTALSPVHGSYCGGGPTSVSEGQAPMVFSRDLRAVPNPLNPLTTLFFQLKEGGRTRLIIYDVRGRLVRTLLDGDLAADDHEIVWDGKDEREVQLSSGVYFVRLIRPGGDSSIAKVALTK
jgi:hypothetical protein